jgi:predicted nucleotidyltransferase
MNIGVDVPDPVRQVVESLVSAAQRAFGDALRSVVLYGSAAEGKLRATSDVNLLFVLRRFDRAQADAFREPFRFAAAAVNATAMFMIDDEIADDAADAFAQKIADIKRRHVVLYGDDPFASVTIDRTALVKRLRQTLLNLTIRLRAMYVERSLREEQCAVTVAESAGPLRAAAASMLDLEGRAAGSPKEALATVVSELGDARFTELLPHLSEARETRTLPNGTAASYFFSTLELAQALYRRSLAL